MPTSPRKSQALLYEDVASRLIRMIDAGTLPVGSRVPSVRKLAREFKVSIATVIAAYRALEDQGRLEARPQSGFYVKATRRQHVAEPPISSPPEQPSLVTVGDLAMQLLTEFNHPGVVPLGAAMGAVSDWPMKRVHALMNSIGRSQPLLSAAYAPPTGVPELRREIARHYVNAGCSFAPDDIVVTCGALEAINLCLRAVTQPGDTVALESPTYWGILQALELFGLKALEIPTHPRTGVSLDALDVVLSQKLVKAVVLIPSVNNPLGSVMPEDHKRRVIDMTRAAGVPLIEDDIYAELAYQPLRPRAARSHDPAPSHESHVMLCGGVSKTIATGLRIGWCMPGRWRNDVAKAKAWLNIASPTLPQLALSQFLEHGGFDRHIRKVRATYQKQVELMSELLAQHLPTNSRITRPQGGFLLWVELPDSIDSVKLHQQALKKNISICPGVVFSATAKYRNYIRINCGMPWKPDIQPAVQQLGELIKHQLK
jgi:DNA-binding transcriptional MocR family regulator